MTLVDQTVSCDAPDFRSALLGAALPTDDLADPGRTYFRFAIDGRPVGFGGYEIYGSDMLLRSVVVLPERRGRGLGRLLVERVLAHAAEAGARRAYLLTTSAEGFFEKAGFKVIDRAEAPAAILATRQASAICTTAPLLTRSVKPSA
jgi:N-acetylglutamate synthase-like GNAT family acetyltransferase